jgi:hypothetical protein
VTIPIVAQGAINDTAHPVAGFMPQLVKDKHTQSAQGRSRDGAHGALANRGMAEMMPVRRPRGMAGGRLIHGMGPLLTGMARGG